VRSGEEWFTAMQDDIDAREIMPGGVGGDAVYSHGCHLRTHPVGQLPPALISHFIDVAI